MVKYLIDTSVVVDVLRGRFSLESALGHEPLLVFCTPVITELLYGALSSRRPEHHKEQVLRLLSKHEMVFSNFEVADHFAQLKFRLTKEGSRIPDNDIWIVAFSITYRIPILTRDYHFKVAQNIDGVEILFLENENQ